MIQISQETCGEKEVRRKKMKDVGVKVKVDITQEALHAHYKQ